MIEDESAPDGQAPKADAQKADAQKADAQKADAQKAGVAQSGPRRRKARMADPTVWQSLPQNRPMTTGPNAGRKPPEPLRLSVSTGFAGWLQSQNIALALSTYEAGKIVMLGAGDGVTPSVSERNFGRAMALALDGGSLYAATGFTIWRFDDALAGSGLYGGWDRFFMPRISMVTGAVDIHDIKVMAPNHLLLAVTKYNCVARSDGFGAFSPLWLPPFITQVVGQDRCHLNGFTSENDYPLYVSVIDRCDVQGRWRDHRHDGGVIYHAPSNEVVVSGLAMPHSPQWHDGALWLLESGRGYLLRVEPNSGRVERIAWVAGFCRGLRLIGGYAVIGLSKPRNGIFSGLPLDEELKQRERVPLCGVAIVDLATGEVVEQLNLGGTIGEIYDVLLLPDCRRPFLVGLQGEEAHSLIALGRDLRLPDQPPMQRIDQIQLPTVVRVPAPGKKSPQPSRDRA